MSLHKLFAHQNFVALLLISKKGPIRFSYLQFCVLFFTTCYPYQQRPTSYNIQASSFSSRFFPVQEVIVIKCRSTHATLIRIVIFKLRHFYQNSFQFKTGVWTFWMKIIFLISSKVQNERKIYVLFSNKFHFFNYNGLTWNPENNTYFPNNI